MYTEVIIMKLQLQLRLRDLREDNDMTQAAMANLLKCSQQTYSRYESHTTEIPLESLITLAEFYNTSIDYLLGITNVKEPYKRHYYMNIALQLNTHGRRS